MTMFAFLAAALGVLAWKLLCWPVATEESDPAGAPAAPRAGRGLKFPMALLMASVALGGYAWIGSPGLLSVGPGAAPGDAAVAIAAALHARAQKNPTDALAWYQWGRAEFDQGHLSNAVQAHRHALALRPNDPGLLADTADLLAVQAQGALEGEPLELVERALAIDPEHLKALAMKGGAAAARHDYAGAAAAWERALQAAPPEHPIAIFLKQQIGVVRQLAARGEGRVPAAAGSAAASR